MYLASSSIDEKTFMAEPVTDFKDIQKVMPIIELAYYLNNKENPLFNKFWLSKLKFDCLLCSRLILIIYVTENLLQKLFMLYILIYIFFNNIINKIIMVKHYFILYFSLNNIYICKKICI